jgi:hypothetical protein
VVTGTDGASAVELDNPENQISDRRLPQLSKLPDSHPVLSKQLNLYQNDP